MVYLASLILAAKVTNEMGVSISYIRFCDFVLVEMISVID